MANANINVVANVAGQTFPVNITRSSDGVGVWTPTIPAALPSVTWTKATTTTGTITLAAGHGFTNTDKLDVYWSGGRRYGMTATVTGNSIALSAGAGDDFPATSAVAGALTICKRVAMNAAFDPDDLLVLLVSTDRRAAVEFVDASGVVLYAIDVAAGEFCLWFGNSGITRPFTGNAVASIHVSNSDVTAIANITVAVLYDATP